MHIVVYNKRKEDAMRTFVQVRDEILKNFKDIMSCPRPGVIDLASRLIRIDFRCGGFEKLGGIRPNYYYCCDYDPDVENMLKCGADKCGGSKLEKLEDIRKVVIDFLA